MSINIEALDTLFFRDGKPFTMGQDTSVQSLTFPPVPSVIYGALRSSYISQNIKERGLDALIEQTSKLQIKNIYVEQHKDGGISTILYPMPKDLVVPKKVSGKKNRNFKIAYLKEEVISNSSSGQSASLVFDRAEKLQDGDFYISKDQLELYFEGTLSGLTAVDLGESLSRESKVGIERSNDTHVVVDGMLYKIDMVRPSFVSKDGKTKTLSIGVETCEELKFPRQQFAQLGGERRVVHFSEAERKEVFYPEIKSEEFKIYLATPAIFEAGWYPKKFLDKFNLEISSAAIGKPIQIGGWDVKARAPKPMLKAVAAGAVYNLKAVANKPNRVQEAIEYVKQYKSISELETANQGFGITFIANKIS